MLQTLFSPSPFSVIFVFPIGRHSVELMVDRKVLRMQSCCEQNSAEMATSKTRTKEKFGKNHCKTTTFSMCKEPHWSQQSEHSHTHSLIFFLLLFFLPDFILMAGAHTHASCIHKAEITDIKKFTSFYRSI